MSGTHRALSCVFCCLLDPSSAGSGQQHYGAAIHAGEEAADLDARPGDEHNWRRSRGPWGHGFPADSHQLLRRRHARRRRVVPTDPPPPSCDHANVSAAAIMERTYRWSLRWEQWRYFFFKQTTPGGGPIHSLLKPISRAKYPALTEEEEAISVPLQLLAQVTSW